jgi:hypothetical protein
MINILRKITNIAKNKIKKVANVFKKDKIDHKVSDNANLGYGHEYSIALAKRIRKRRAKNKVAKESRKRNRGKK